MSEDKKKPDAKFSIGLVTATVWKNNGFYNVVLSRSYKDDEKWHSTDALAPSDLLNAAKALQRAEEYLSGIKF